MSRKHYQLIAAAIQGAYRKDALSEIHALIDALARENPRFDRSKFLTACGLGR